MTAKFQLKVNRSTFEICSFPEVFLNRIYKKCLQRIQCVACTHIYSLIRVSRVIAIHTSLDVSGGFCFFSTLSLPKSPQPHWPLTISNPLLNFKSFHLPFSAPNNNKNKQISWKKIKNEKPVQFLVPEQLCSCKEETLEHQWTVLANLPHYSRLFRKASPCVQVPPGCKPRDARTVQCSDLSTSHFGIGCTRW